VKIAVELLQDIERRFHAFQRQGKGRSQGSGLLFVGEISHVGRRHTAALLESMSLVFLGAA